MRVKLLLSALILIIVMLEGVSSRAQDEPVWKVQKSGVLSKLTSVFFVDEKQGWITGSNGTLMSTSDAGASWRRVPLPERESREALNDLWFFNATNGCVLGEYGVFSRQSSGKFRERVFLLASSDAGANWAANKLAERQAATSEKGGISGRKIDQPTDDQTTDGATGKPAAPIEGPRPLAGFVLTRLAFANRSVGWACGEAGMIQATDNGGATWRLQTSTTNRLLYDIAAIDEKTAVVVGAAGTILRTQDGGKTWSAQSSGQTGILRAVHFTDAKRGWIAGSKGLLLTTDNAGVDWKQQQSGVEQHLNDLYFLNQHEGWAAGDRGVLIHTTDGGATWVVQGLDTHANLSRLHFLSPESGWAVGSSGTILRYGK
jgi:photosystem II stability/assembly factor-like uncharacterized protein